MDVRTHEMTGELSQENASLSRAGNSSSESSDHLSSSSRPEKYRRHATLFDAVAGRVPADQRVLNPDGFRRNPKHPRITRHPTAETPAAPDEALFRRRGAPDRFAEHDIYFSHERELPNGGRGVLPESDLLKTVHAYSSKFYSTLPNKTSKQASRRHLDDTSMDETALIAFGILLEEAGKDVLGRHGDLVLTEGVDESDVARERQGSNSGEDLAEESSSPGESRKRRKISEAAHTLS